MQLHTICADEHRSALRRFESPNQRSLRQSGASVWGVLKNDANNVGQTIIQRGGIGSSRWVGEHSRSLVGWIVGLAGPSQHPKWKSNRPLYIAIISNIFLADDVSNSQIRKIGTRRFKGTRRKIQKIPKIKKIQKIRNDSENKTVSDSVWQSRLLVSESGMTH